MNLTRFTSNLCLGQKNLRSLFLSILSSFSRLSMPLYSYRALMLLVVVALGIVLLYTLEDKYPNGGADFNSPQGVKSKQIPFNLYPAIKESEEHLYKIRHLHKSRQRGFSIILNQNYTQSFPSLCEGYFTFLLGGNYPPDNNLSFISLLLRSPPKVFS